MYESFYGLNRRPFAAAPDSDCFYVPPSVREVLRGLVSCVENGQGIGILTGTAGTGKSLICEKLSETFSQAFQVVLLSNSNFSTRRSFLQSVLYELHQPFNRMGEQELRLSFVSAIKQCRPNYQGVVLVVDEAHMLGEDILEEIRSATNLIEDGEPLVRTILSGQHMLEEKLASPAMAALNQRVGAQLVLDPLSQQESAEYITHRLRWAGADIHDIFSPEAVSTIVHASDGLPRCLNQLCDHSLLLSYVASEQPVATKHVLEALEDLKQLPLHWNDPINLSTPSDAQVHRTDTSEPEWQQDDVVAPGESAAILDDVWASNDEYQSLHNDEDIVSRQEYGQPDTDGSTIPAIEFGGIQSDAVGDHSITNPWEGEQHSDSTFLETVEIGQCDVELPRQSETEIATSGGVFESHEIETGSETIDESTSEAIGFVEEIVHDRYAAIDAGVQQGSVSGIVWDLASSKNTIAAETTLDESLNTSQTQGHGTGIESQQINEAGLRPDTRSDFHEWGARDLRPDLAIDEMLPLIEKSLEVTTASSPGASGIAVDIRPSGLEQAGEFHGQQSRNENDSTTDLDVQSQLVAAAFNADADDEGEIEADIASDVVEMCLDVQQSLLAGCDPLGAVSFDTLGTPRESATPMGLESSIDVSSFQYDVVEPEGRSELTGNGPGQVHPTPLTASHVDENASHQTQSTSQIDRPYGRLFSTLRRQHST